MAFFLLRPCVILLLILLILVILVPSIFGQALVKGNGNRNGEPEGLVSLDDARMLTRVTQQLIGQMELKAKESAENEKEWKETLLNVLSESGGGLQGRSGRFKRGVDDHQDPLSPNFINLNKTRTNNASESDENDLWEDTDFDFQVNGDGDALNDTVEWDLGNGTVPRWIDEEGGPISEFNANETTKWVGLGVGILLLVCLIGVGIWRYLRGRANLEAYNNALQEQKDKSPVLPVTYKSRRQVGAGDSEEPLTSIEIVLPVWQPTSRSPKNSPAAENRDGEGEKEQ